MVFEAFVVLPNGSEMRFPYSTNLGSMTGSVFNGNFDLSVLSPMKFGLSPGSIGIDFYDGNTKRISCAILMRSDIQPNCLDIDCFTREYLSDGTTPNPKGFNVYKEASFHNLKYDSVSSGLTIGFCNVGSEIKQTLTPEEVIRLFEVN